jgi:L-threonylcarbamoyladenylate synthase
LDQIREQNEFIKVDTEKGQRTGLKRAAEVILASGVVALPTESFYGLAVNAIDEKAIKRLLAIKKRQQDHPILILISAKELLPQYVVHIPEIAHQLIARFWPGGLTMIFEAGPAISPLLTAGTGKIGVRFSSHSIPTSLARVAGVPITGTSANISGQPACATAKGVSHALGKKVDLILDGGETKGGQGSTILDVTVTPPVVLREGMVGRDQLKAFIF